MLCNLGEGFNSEVVILPFVCWSTTGERALGHDEWVCRCSALRVNLSVMVWVYQNCLDNNI